MIARLAGFIAIATGLLTACGGGAVLSQSSNNPQEDTEFCGVNIKFSDKPKTVSKRESDEFLESFGKFVKNNVTGLYVDKHQLTEVALCLCANTTEPTGMTTQVSPGKGATNIKETIIDGIGPSESWDLINSPRKYHYKVLDLSSRSSCQLIQYVVTPVNSNSYSTFLDSATETRSRVNVQNRSTPKDRLIQLEELKKNNLISQSDYEIKKKAILDSF